MFDYTFSLSFTFFKRLLKKIRGVAITTSSEIITAKLRKSVCKFQLEYTNYQFSCSRYHRNFKQAKKNEKDSSYEKLNLLVESGMKKIFGDISTEITDYFSETHNSAKAPRIGIHLLTNKNEVINILQTDNEDINKLTKRIPDFTVLDIVVKTGKVYMQNFIPKHIVKNLEPFKHGDLDIAHIRSNYKLNLLDYKYPSRWRRAFNNKLHIDEEWAKILGKEHGEYHTMFKSHMIVPITFRGHAEKYQLNDEMIRILQLDHDGRSILGFLIVDHPETYYFHDTDKEDTKNMNIDINSLIIFADMLSLVIVTKLMYTTGSSSVQEHIQMKNKGWFR